MSKSAITYGVFDCLKKEHFHLIKEMRKSVLPGTDVAVVVPDDYACFVNNGYFPVQILDHRYRNASYLCKKVIKSFSEKPDALFEFLFQEAQKEGRRLIYVGYDDEKEFPGKSKLQDLKVPLKFIKRPKYGEETKNN